MDQREFLSQLIEELKYLKPKDANEVVKFYQQKISTALDYGEKEEKITHMIYSIRYQISNIKYKI